MDNLSRLLERYGLPGFNVLNQEFDFSSIEKEPTLRDIRRCMSDKVEAFAKLFESFFQPDPALPSIREASFFSELEKSEVFNLYAKLMYIIRANVELELLNDEKQDSEFIKANFAAWCELKPNMLKIICKIKDSWEKDNNIKTKLGYMG